MVYYRINKKYLEKQEVVLDEKQLEELRKQIIENCSKIIHIERKDPEGGLDCFDLMHVKNFIKVFVGIREYNDFYSPDENIYLYSYDRYIEPYLATLIGKLLNGDLSVIEKIENYDLSTYFINEMKEEIKNKEVLIKHLEEIKKQYHNLPDDINELISVAREKLKQIEKELELNKNQKPINEYYKRVLKCISFKTIDKKKLSDIMEIQDFLNGYNDTMAAMCNKKYTCK